MKSFQKVSLKFLPILFLIVAPFIYSCKEKTPPKTVDSATESPATNGAPNSNAVFSGDATGLNPAHGQPGHRCDIKVGEPLNTPSKSLNTNTNQQSPVIINNNTVPAGNTGSGKVNPPHGQPGHVCG